MKEIDKVNRRNSILQTREKRKSQVCKVYELKFDASHLSKEKINWLNKLFLEAKWFYNSIIASNDVFKFDDKIKQVTVLNKNKEEEIRNINCLTAQMKQSIKDRCIDSIKSLSTKKKKVKQKEVGKLKFKSRIESIPLKQFGVTYRIENNKYIFIQGFKKHFKVNGLDQIIKGTEFANATLIKKASGFYLKVTCYVPKVIKEKTGNNIGLDFGIKDSVATSNGDKYFFNFPETKRIKEISKKFNKSKKGTKKRNVLYNQLQIAYEKNSNKKKDVKNKFVSKLIKENDIVAIQNENIKAWHKSKMKGFGRRIQHSIMGGIISDLKKKSETIIIDRFFPSTQLCSECGSLNKHGLESREYNCSCGYSKDRDIHSAVNILNEGLRILGMEYIKLLEEEKSTTIKDLFLIARKYLMTQEAKCL
jgi:putative transposase